jgi:hypothetical protein
LELKGIDGDLQQVEKIEKRIFKEILKIGK